MNDKFFYPICFINLRRFLQNAIEFRKKNPEKTLTQTKKEGKKFFHVIILNQRNIIPFNYNKKTNYT